MEDWAEIRHLHASQGMSIRAIAKHLSIARDIVTRALTADGPPRYVRAAGPSRFDEFEPRVRGYNQRRDLRVHGARALGVQSTCNKPGSTQVNDDHVAEGLRSTDHGRGQVSQVDSAGSIPVTRSTRENRCSTCESGNDSTIRVSARAG